MGVEKTRHLRTWFWQRAKSIMDMSFALMECNETLLVIAQMLCSSDSWDA
jgi:hypothetical protein